MKSGRMIVAVSALLCVALALAGCGRPSGDELMAKLKVGMTEDEVKAELGKPVNNRPMAEGRRMYAYRIKKGYLVVIFLESKVESFEKKDQLVFK